MLLLAAGGVGWLILFISLVGGCDKTVIQTVPQPPVTVTETMTVTTPSSGAAASPPGTTDTGGATTSPGESTVGLRVLTALGAVDPAPEIGRTFEFDVATPVDATLFVRFRQAGGSPCAPTQSTDNGTEFFSHEVAAGHRAIPFPYVWPNSGTFLFCMWLGAQYDDPASRVFSATVRFRQPRGFVHLSSSPTTPRTNSPVTLRFRGRTEVPRYLFVRQRHAGGGACAPTAYSDTGTEILNAQVDGGFNVPYVTSYTEAGTYKFCAWLASSGSDDTTPLGGVRSFTLEVR